jgi:hypothetical protein
MSGWSQIDLTKVNPTLEPIAAGQYEFSLAGAKYDEKDPNRIRVQAVIASDGEFTGKHVFFSYPDPEILPDSPKLLARLMVALGVDAVPGEDPVSYLNRANGARFRASIKHRVDKQDENVKYADLNIFSVKAA